MWEPLRVTKLSDGAAKQTISHFIVSYQTEWKRESGQSGGGHGFAAALVQNKARGSAIGAGFESDLFVSHPGEELLLAFGKQFKLRRGGRIARPIVRKLYEGLYEEAVAVAGDFENEVRRHPIAPGVVIEELRVNRNLHASLWGLGIGKRHLRVQEMTTDVIDTARSSSIGQYNDPDPRSRIAPGK